MIEVLSASSPAKRPDPTFSVMAMIFRRKGSRRAGVLVTPSGYQRIARLAGRQALSCDSDLRLHWESISKTPSFAETRCALAAQYLRSAVGEEEVIEQYLGGLSC